MKEISYETNGRLTIKERVINMSAKIENSNLSIEALREAHLLAEAENSNLRKILLWSAQFIPDYRRHELAEKIKNKENGVVEDLEEDNFIENRDFCKMVDEVVDLYDRVITTGKIPRECNRSSLLISKIRELLPKKYKPTVTSLAEIREWKK